MINTEITIFFLNHSDSLIFSIFFAFSYLNKESTAFTSTATCYVTLQLTYKSLHQNKTGPGSQCIFNNYNINNIAPKHFTQIKTIELLLLALIHCTALLLWMFMLMLDKDGEAKLREKKIFFLSVIHSLSHTVCGVFSSGWTSCVALWRTHKSHAVFAFDLLMFNINCPKSKIFPNNRWWSILRD